MKKSAEKTTVMVFGTFDGLHKGHLNFLQQARKLTPNPFLVVSVARGRNVFRIKGKYPKKGERERASLIRKSGLADKVVLGGLRNHIPHIVKEKPDIIALGYDQNAYVAHLKKELKNQGIKSRVARLKPFKEKIYKSHLLN